jgi:tRNA A-37 threonylcarbamoyl transferase component Bud32
MTKISNQTHDEPTTLLEERSVDRLCDRFEAALRAGLHPGIDSYLQETAPTAREAALEELIALEVEYRANSGDTPAPGEYATRFADSPDVVTSVFQRISTRADDARSADAGPPPTSDTTAWLLPEIPGYEVINRVGAGGMGVVFKARQQSVSRVVALKLIRPEICAGPRERARFRLEVEAAARLQHANVVQVYESGEHKGQPFAVLEFVEGKTLSQHVTAGPLPVSEAAAIIEELARAVQHAHDRGILHRDLKPANVLITTDGTPKIADFGLARLLDAPSEHSASGDLLGTPSYMAPEQVSGRRETLTPATDVYGLGAILYELLTGQPVFRGRTTLDTLEQVRSRVPPSPRRLRHDLPRDLETICLKCLAKEPDLRYAKAVDLADDLKRWLADEPIQARRAGRLRKTLRLGWRRRGAMALVLVLAAALISAPTVLRRPSPDDLEAQFRDKALADLRLRLQNGQAVDLVGATGAPAYCRWVTEAPHQRFFTGMDGTSTVQVQLEGLLELVPAPLPEQYRFEAEIKHIAAEHNLGYAGLYFAHNRFHPVEGEGHTFVGLFFDDLRDEAASNPAAKLPGNSLFLYRRVIFEPIMAGPACALARNHYFKPTAPNALSTWRKIKIEVTRQAVEVFWEGKLSHRFTPADVVISPLPGDKRYDTSTLPFDSQGGLGIHLHLSMASYRNVRLEPIFDR